MVNLDTAELRLNLDLEGKYVDFSLLRTSLTVTKLIEDLQIALSEPSKEGECRGKCPKCDRDRSFSLNIKTSRFNCFAKGCALKGGGVIDFFARLNEVPAKEASHLLACAYGIPPYNQEIIEAANNRANETPVADAAPIRREVSKPSPGASQTVPPLTPRHLIASIEQQLAELKQLLVTR